MSDIARLGIQVDSSQVTQANRELGNLEQQGGRTERSAGGLTRAFAAKAAALGGAVLSIRSLHQAMQRSVREYAQREQAEISLRNALGETEAERAIVTEGIIDYANELQNLTTFSSEATTEAAALLAQMTDLNSEGIQQALPAVQDLATAFDMDLSRAAQLVGREIEGTGNGLSRYGIEIDSALEGSERMEAVLGELDQRFGGLSEDMGEASTGAIPQFQNSVSDLFAEIGQGVTGAIEPFVRGLTDIVDEMAEARSEANELREALERIGEGEGDVEDQITVLTNQLEELQERRARAEESASRLSESAAERTLASYDRQIERIQDQIDLHEAEAAAIEQAREEERERDEAWADRRAEIEARMERERELAEEIGEARESASERLRELEIEAMDPLERRIALLEEERQEVQDQINLAHEQGLAFGDLAVLRNELNDLIAESKEELEAERNASDDVNEEVERMIENLESQARGLRMSEQELTRYRAEAAGANETQLEMIESLSAEVQALERQQEAYRTGQQIKRELMTDDERLAEGLREIEEAYDAGALSADQAARATRRLKAELDDVAEFPEEIIRGLNATDVAVAVLTDDFQDLWREIMEGSEDAMDRFNRAMAAGLTIAMPMVEELVSQFEELGRSIGDASEDTMQWEEFAARFLANSLRMIPGVLIQIAAQVAATGNWPLALGLLAAAGVAAVGAGAASAAIENNTSNNAQGAAYEGGQQRFASGGVVRKPTTFAFAGGTGLMGEAGPEAVMPLSRTNSGELGVKAQGSGGGENNTNVNVHNYSGEQTRTRERDTPSGKQIDIMIGESQERNMDSGRADSAMRRNYRGSRRKPV